MAFYEAGGLVQRCMPLGGDIADAVDSDEVLAGEAGHPVLGVIKDPYDLLEQPAPVESIPAENDAGSE